MMLAGLWLYWRMMHPVKRLLYTSDCVPVGKPIVAIGGFRKALVYRHGFWVWY